MKKAFILTIVFAAMSTMLSSCVSNLSCKAPSGFVYIAEAVPDAILEIRYYSTYNFVGDRIDGYEQPTAMLTVEAARALKAVSDLWLQTDSGFSEDSEMAVNQGALVEMGHEKGLRE